MSDFAGRRVLVTGATGFIGGRLVEQLVCEGAEVRALVRNFARAPRIARFNVDMIAGDIITPDAVDRAVAGCDTVFHCAYGSSGDESARRTITVDGTRALLDAALRHRVRRVVHTSTCSVYGDPPSGTLDESAPRRYTGAAYGDTKLDAETLALSYCGKGLSVAVVQPTIVYGPYASTWTVKPLEQLASGRVILVNGGNGVCNLVYVDDVVAAMLKAAIVDAAHGEAFLVSGDTPISWADFFRRCASFVRACDPISMTVDEATAYYEGQGPRGLMSEAMRVVRREIGRREQPLRERLGASRPGQLALKTAEAFALLPHPGTAKPAADREEPPPIHPLPPAKIRMFASTARVSIDKAARLVGYRPAFDVDRGMALTANWAQWANIANG